MQHTATHCNTLQDMRAFRSLVTTVKEEEKEEAEKHKEEEEMEKEGESTGMPCAVIMRCGIL